MCPPLPRPSSAPRLGTLTATLERRADGSAVVRCRQPLGPYPRAATERFRHWAAAAPDRDCFAWRTPAGEIARLTYGEALSRVRRLGQALLDRGVDARHCLVILSANAVEHALLTLAAMHVGACVVPVSPAYSLVSQAFDLLRHVLSQLSPRLVFVDDGSQFDAAVRAAISRDAELVVARGASPSRASTPFASLLDTPATGAVDRAYEAVGPETIAKILFTSGSTGVPKGVVNTHRMLTSNQQMIAQTFPFLADEPPLLVDWLPWHHTFGGNHNLGLVLHHGGTLFIDEGRPLPGAFERTVRNLRDVPPTFYLNVPKGFEELVAACRRDPELRRAFFSRLRLIFYAAASLSQHVADELDALAVETRGEPVPLVTALGATETAPLALARPWRSAAVGSIGLPAPGLEAKLVPCEERLELRVRGPNITPGYVAAPEATRAAFDDEGFYCLGDAVRFADPDDVDAGLVFDGRIAEDFKLATGTWVHVGALRLQALAALAPFVRDVAVAGHDRDAIGLLVFPDLDACRRLCPELPDTVGASDVLRHPDVRARFAGLLEGLAAGATGSANRIVRLVLLDTPPSLDAQEVTDKGSLNQHAVLGRRASSVEALYAEPPADDVIHLRSV